MTMLYEWKPDSRFPIGAKIAAERLAMIRDSMGELTPRHVVNDAASDNSPLHKCFEWNDTKAADNYRLDQARKLIGSIVVAQVNDQPVKKETRAFVHIENGGARYEPIEVAMAHSDMRSEVLARAQREIKMWRARYSAYSEFAQLHSKIDELLAVDQAA